MQLIPAGTFSGRDGRGPYDAGDKSSMEKIVAASLERAGSSEIVIDYDHQGVFGAVEGVGGRAPAAGWVKEFEVRDTGIWGLVDWTKAANTAITDKEYKYLSPVFSHTKAGKVLEIAMAALTNTPNLDLAEVAAFSKLTRQETTMDKIIAALGLKEDSKEDAVLTALNSVLVASAAVVTATGLGKDAKPDAVLAAIADAFSTRLAVAKAVGAADNAKGEVIITAVASAVAGGSSDDPDPTKFVPIAQFKELSNQVATMSASIEGDKATDAVEAAMSDGKVSPASKEWAINYAKKDLDGFNAFIATAPVIVSAQASNLNPQGDGSTADDVDKITEKARAYMSAQKDAGNEVSFVTAVEHVEKNS